MGTKSQTGPVEYPRYDVFLPLNEGTEAKLFLAHDRRLDRLVTLRCIQHAGDTITAKRPETQLAFALTHSHLLRYYNVIPNPNQINWEPVRVFLKEQEFAYPTIYSTDFISWEGPLSPSLESHLDLYLTGYSRLWHEGHFKDREYLIRHVTSQGVETYRLPGLNLRKVLELWESSLFPLHWVRRIAFELLELLRFLHAHGHIHRDLKSANVMLAFPPPTDSLELPELPWIRLIDLGTTRRLGVTTISHSTVKATTTSPNQKIQVEAEADLYAFAVLLYELLSGSIASQQEISISDSIQATIQSQTLQERREQQASDLSPTQALSPPLLKLIQGWLDTKATGWTAQGMEEALRAIPWSQIEYQQSLRAEQAKQHAIHLLNNGSLKTLSDLGRVVSLLDQQLIEAGHPDAFVSSLKQCCYTLYEELQHSLLATLGEGVVTWSESHASVSQGDKEQREQGEEGSAKAQLGNNKTHRCDMNEQLMQYQKEHFSSDSGPALQTPVPHTLPAQNAQSMPLLQTWQTPPPLPPEFNEMINAHSSLVAQTNTYVPSYPTSQESDTPLSRDIHLQQPESSPHHDAAQQSHEGHKKKDSE